MGIPAPCVVGAISRWRRSAAGPSAVRSRLAVLAGVAVAVAIEAEVVGAYDAHGARVLRPVAPAARAVVVGRREVEAGALVGRVAVPAAAPDVRRRRGAALPDAFAPAEPLRDLVGAQAV